MSTFHSDNHTIDSRSRAALLEQQSHSTPLFGDYNQYYSEYSYSADFQPVIQNPPSQDNSPIRTAIREAFKSAVKDQVRQESVSNEKRTIDPNSPKPSEVKKLFDWKWGMIITILFDVRN